MAGPNHELALCSRETVEPRKACPVHCSALFGLLGLDSIPDPSDFLFSGDIDPLGASPDGGLKSIRQHTTREQLFEFSPTGPDLLRPLPFEGAFFPADVVIPHQVAA